MKKDITDDEFLGNMDFATSNFKDFARLVEFTEGFFKRVLDVENIEDSQISFPKMSARVYVYLFASLLLEYNDIEKRIPVGSDGNKSNGVYFIHVGNVNSKMDFNNHEVSVFDDDLEELGIEMKEGTLLIFTMNQLNKILEQVAKAIQSSEQNGN